ncbi:MAG: hypothetical protein HOV81_07930 [Kofleriaceae bacterium]|nr:hypothetical protein [Kofleriaceae bacterium]
MDEPVTRRELHEALDIWAGAIMSQMNAQLAAQTAQLTAHLTAHLTEVIDVRCAAAEQRLATDLARHVQAADERMRAFLAGFEDKYRDLPPRVTKLEAKVFAPKRRRAPKAPRRR